MKKSLLVIPSLLRMTTMRSECLEGIKARSRNSPLIYQRRKQNLMQRVQRRGRQLIDMMVLNNFACQICLLIYFKDMCKMVLPSAILLASFIKLLVATNNNNNKTLDPKFEVDYESSTDQLGSIICIMFLYFC